MKTLIIKSFLTWRFIQVESPAVQNDKLSDLRKKLNNVQCFDNFILDAVREILAYANNLSPDIS